MQPCYLCSHPTYVFLTVKNKSILRCSNCKLTFTPDSTPRDGRIREDSEKFVQEYLDEVYLFNEYFDTFIEIIRKHKKPRTLLDIGSGVGIFLQNVKDAGWKGVGVDLSSDSVTYARSRGLDVHLGKIEDLNLPPATFDVITLFQTIEHIENPVKMLKKIYFLLRKGGMLIVTTPNEESLMAKIMGKFWFGYRNIEHQYFFNNQSLAVTIKKAGFSKIAIESENGRVLSVPWVLTRIFEYYYNQWSPLVSVVLKSKPYWKYLRWMRFREPDVNLVSIAVK